MGAVIFSITRNLHPIQDKLNRPADKENVAFETQLPLKTA